MDYKYVLILFNAIFLVTLLNFFFSKDVAIAPFGDQRTPRTLQSTEIFSLLDRIETKVETLDSRLAMLDYIQSGVNLKTKVEISKIESDTSSVKADILKSLRTLDLLHTETLRRLNRLEDSIEKGGSISPENRQKIGIPIKGSKADKRIVVSHFDEDISWIRASLSRYEVLIYTHGEGDFPEAIRILPNIGRESTLYLTHIIDYYESLADVTVFVHAHEMTWHSHNIQHSINNLRWDQVMYAPFHSFYYSNGVADIKPDSSSYKELAKIWPKYFEPYLSYPMPPVIRHTCCSEFAVSKEIVLLRPLAFYKGLYEWTMSANLEDRQIGHIMEISWHMIFSQPPVMEKQYFDFCTKVVYCDNLDPSIVKFHSEPLDES